MARTQPDSTPVSASAAPRSPRVGDKASSQRSFRPLIELGRGGMARVYLAESLGSGIQKLVVLKILNQELARDAAMRAAFLNEALISGRMNHPNVVQVHEVLEHRATEVIVMEYIDGFPLSRIVQEKSAPLSVRLHLSIVLQMLSGLHYFHELADLDGAPLNGVHRDVSPHNVLVSHDGQTKVADFGIAKINAPMPFATQTGLVKGKIHYMAPEQILGDQVDRRTDVFAAGVLLWEALAERRLWIGRSPAQVMRALTDGKIPQLSKAAPSAPPALVEVASRATAVSLKERYGTVLEMLEALERAMAQTTGVAPQREIAEFMASAFGELRALQQQSVNHALRHPEVAPLGILDCWTTGYAAQRRAPAASGELELRFDTPTGIAHDLADGAPRPDGLLAAEATLMALLPRAGASTSTAVERATAVEPRRPLRKGVVWLGAAALLLSGAAWLLPALAAPRAEPVRVAGAGVAASTPSAPAPAAPLEPVESGRGPVDARLEQDEPSEQADPEPSAAPPAPRTRGAGRRHRAPAPSAATSAGAANCSPPFRILPSGLKRFKPECFAGAAPAAK